MQHKQLAKVPQYNFAKDSLKSRSNILQQQLHSGSGTLNSYTRTEKRAGHDITLAKSVALIESNILQEINVPAIATQPAVAHDSLGKITILEPFIEFRCRFDQPVRIVMLIDTANVQRLNVQLRDPIVVIFREDRLEAVEAFKKDISVETRRTR